MTYVISIFKNVTSSTLAHFIVIIIGLAGSKSKNESIQSYDMYRDLDLYLKSENE